MRLPVLRRFTMTWLFDTYIISNFPLYLYLRMHASKSSTPPHKLPRAILEPSGFHTSALTVYRFGIVFTHASSHCCLCVFMLKT